MKETILSVGIDLGTTTTQMIVSRLTVENTASAFSVPHMEISDREILYRSRIRFTPLLSDTVLDADRIKTIISEEYEMAGISPSDVQTGAVIITGETARKENAKAVLETLKDHAGKFVVATAGPALESVLAARGAGADRYANSHRTAVLHMDIGGGTTNLALFDSDGTLLETGCVNIGGRLLKFDESGKVTYRSAVLSHINTLSVGEQADPARLQPLIDLLVRGLEEAAGLRPRSEIDAFVTDRLIELNGKSVTISFSGGVAALIEADDEDWLRFGDLGVLLGKAIRQSKLCQGSYVLGKETVQATVVGAGSYTTELSGSTVDHHGAEFPLQDLPVAALSVHEERLGPESLGAVIRKKLALHQGSPVALAMGGSRNLSYDSLQTLADGLWKGLKQAQPPLVIVLREDMAKALGQALRGRMGNTVPLICLDGLSMQDGSYLDIGAPVGGGTALPVVVKTLAFL